MSIFSFFKSSANNNEDEAMHAIIDVACFGIGVSNNRDKNLMEKTLLSTEKHLHSKTGARLLYWLGIGWRNYTAWHMKGTADRIGVRI